MRVMNLVLVTIGENKKPYLFEAPRTYYFKEGDSVIVDTVKGIQCADVIAATICTADSSSEFDMIVKLAGATLPLKRVIGKVDVIEYEGETA